MRTLLIPTLLLFSLTTGCAALRLDGNGDLPKNWDDPNTPTASAPASEPSSSGGFFGLFDGPSSAPNPEERPTAQFDRDEYSRRPASNSSDLYPGMMMDEVRTSWGEPIDVETAGDPRYGNQRWVYSSSVSSRYGLKNARMVYFERGRVVGWETVSE